ncbi:MAG: T9SS type A sorting domain-containing protein, partial [Candidatus Cloacimonetes bacterium]|nr:T9SS type A sorting domain-containing protein [Candidatus Cloacimonadota bacterium]
TVNFVLEPMYGNLDGTVTSSTTGEPFEDALITATSQGRVEYTGYTNADGYYIIDSLLVSEIVGNYTVTCDVGDPYPLVEETDVEIVAGNTTTVDFVLAPPIVWEYSGNLFWPTDAERLLNGNTLITEFIAHYVIEVTPDGSIGWIYDVGEFGYPTDAERLSNGNTLINKFGRPDIPSTNSVIEVTPNGTIVWEYGIGLRPFDAERLPNGNTLIALFEDSVIEVTTDGTIVWEYITASSFLEDVERLPNGNTLITYGYNNLVIEVNPDGTIVWEYTGNLSWPTDAKRLPNGNTLIAYYYSNCTIEVTPDGTIVWEYSGGGSVTQDVEWLANNNILITEVDPARVIEVYRSAIQDTIPPYVTVDIPNGGEVWTVGHSHQIQWTADDDIAIYSDSVFYSIDNGINWIFIEAHIGNPQTCTWTIPDTPSDQCLVKVKVFDLGGNCAEDISDGNFTIFYQEPPPLTYAVVIKLSTYNNPDWQAVADTLIARYQGQLFIWSNSLNEVQANVAAFQPTHIGFVCGLSNLSPVFIQNSVWPFTRALDNDYYCDAVWGIITGYNAEDALNLVTGPTGFEVKTVLGGTGSCDLNYYTQGIGTNESTYGEYYVKNPYSLETTTYTDGPTDRTEWLVTMINEGIDIFNYDPVDIFYTSGHANYNEWQLHYPSSGSEGFFRSINGQVYGDPYSGSNININSDNPKIYFGLGNCYIGQIFNGSCMAPSWIHTGGAYQYTGYITPEGPTSHQHGGTKAYFYRVARNYTWAESFFLANIALKFDMINGTPGANPPDLNGSALYGDPGMQVKMSNEGVFQQPLFTSELFINEGTEKDTVTFKITMNIQGNPGYDGKWGNRHPAMILPFRAEDIEIIYTDAMAVVVEDNFALMYIWYQGQPSLAEGETREVTFTCNHIGADIDEPTLPPVTKVDLYQNYPNPFNPETTILYALPKLCKVSLKIYNIKGQLVKTLVSEKQDAGRYSVTWKSRDNSNKPVSSGIYFYRITTGNFTDTKKCIILK